LFWAGVGWIAYRQYQHALTAWYLGLDARPLKGAGRAVLNGTDVYAVHNFVYPPSAAVLLIPLGVVDETVLARAAVIVGEVAVAGLAVVVVLTFVPRRRWRAALPPLLAVGLLAGFVSYHALALGNVSVLLAPVIAGVAALGGRGRWSWASALLVLTLLVKPLLAPVVLVPFLARRWRPPLVCLAVAGVLTLASLPLTGGVGRVAEVVRTLLQGSVLVGSKAGNNLSLTGFASINHVPDDALTVARLVVVFLALLVVIPAVILGRELDTAQLSWTATGLLLAVCLAGNLSEVHYLYALVPGAVAALARARSWVARVLALAGLATLCLPLYGLATPTEQSWSVAAEAVLLVAFTLAALASLRGRTPLGNVTGDAEDAEGTASPRVVRGAIRGTNSRGPMVVETDETQPEARVCWRGP
jgi:arabinofuranan 3-O-arabinosyltransferase